MHVFFTPIARSAEGKADETLLDVARRAAVPLGNACGGIGICARCRVRIVEGAENLTPPTAIETRVSSQRGLDPDERLACQAVVQGNCSITTSYW
jgi:adenylate cyclase